MKALREFQANATRRERGRSCSGRDIGTAAVLALLVLAVYPVHYLLTEPFYFDEQWVALSTRMPLSSLPRVTWTSPIGFSAAIRLIPRMGPERLRVVALVFAAGAVAVAYFLGRELRLTPLGGAITGGAVLLAPLFGQYMELKPYVGEALLTLVMLLLVARLESSWTRRRLVTIGAVGAVGMFVWHTAVFTTAAVMTALLIVSTARHQWQRVKEITVVAVFSLSIIAAEFMLFDRPHQKESLKQFWNFAYIPIDDGLATTWHWFDVRLPLVTSHLGVPWIGLVVLLAMLGIVTLVKLRRVALALVVPLVVILNMAASAMRLYPFLGLYDARTSLFWLVGVLMLMTIGAIGVVRFLGRGHVVLGAVALVVISALWLREVVPDLRRHALPQEPLRHYIEYLDEHQRPEDIVLVNFASAWGYAFYRDGIRIAIADVANPPPGYPDFIPTFDCGRRVVVAQGGQYLRIRAAVATAERCARQLGAQRIWIALSFVGLAERRAWNNALARSQVEVRRRDDHGQSLLLLHLTPQPAAGH